MKLTASEQQQKMVSKLKRLTKEYEKNFASYVSDKGLITRICRELKKLNSEKINHPIKKWATKKKKKKKKLATELKRIFQRKKSIWLIKHEKMCLSLAIKEMQMKTTLRFYLTPVRIAIIQNTTNNKCWQGCGTKEPSYTASGNVS
jgi:phenylalanyl-tRNA synthetase alpha subunit